MPLAYVQLEAWQVAAASALILINAGISLALRLDLHGRLLIASDVAAGSGRSRRAAGARRRP